MDVEAALAEFMVNRGWIYNVVDDEWVVTGPDGKETRLAAVDSNAAWAALTFGARAPRNGQIICVEGCAYCYNMAKQQQSDDAWAEMLLEAKVATTREVGG